MPLQVDVLTLFPPMVEGPLGEGSLNLLADCELAAGVASRVPDLDPPGLAIHALHSRVEARGHLARVCHARGHVGARLLGVVWGPCEGAGEQCGGENEGSPGSHCWWILLNASAALTRT